jgi:hypothetical protein
MASPEDNLPKKISLRRMTTRTGLTAHTRLVSKSLMIEVALSLVQDLI